MNLSARLGKIERFAKPPHNEAYEVHLACTDEAEEQARQRIMEAGHDPDDGKVRIIRLVAMEVRP